MEAYSSVGFVTAFMISVSCKYKVKWSFDKAKKSVYLLKLPVVRPNIKNYTSIWSLSLDGQLLRFFLRKSKLELPLVETIDMLEKANLLSIQMPRYFAAGTSFRISLHRLRARENDREQKKAHVKVSS